MQELYERFYVFIRSAFGEKEKAGLFEFVWTHYHKRIGFYISNLIPFNHPSFDDIFQDVMIKIYENLHTFNPLHSFKSWIYRIARNHCIDYLKNKSESMYNSSDIEIERVEHNENPEKIFMHQELSRKIEQYLGTLPPRDREISFLRFYENMKYRDIGEILGMNVSTVKSRVYAIQKNLARELES
jgi:RNA polymerase sigma-70 factor (ECF subfamily)